MKKQKKESVVVLVMFFCLFYCGPVFSATNYKYYLERGISSLNEDYNSQDARRNFKKIINAPLASDRIKVRAYFWTAYSYLFDGLKDTANGTFREMFQFKNDVGYRFEPGIDEMLLNNGELMRLYDLEYKKFYKKAYEEGANEGDVTIKMNYLTRMILMGGVVVIALIVVFI